MSLPASKAMGWCALELNSLVIELEKASNKKEESNKNADLF